MNQRELALVAKNIEHWSKRINQLKRILKGDTKERLKKFGDQWKKELKLKEAQVIVWLSELEANGVVATDVEDTGDMTAKG